MYVFILWKHLKWSSVHRWGDRSRGRFFLETPTLFTRPLITARAKRQRCKSSESDSSSISSHQRADNFRKINIIPASFCPDWDDYREIADRNGLQGQELFSAQLIDNDEVWVWGPSLHAAPEVRACTLLLCAKTRRKLLLCLVTWIWKGERPVWTWSNVANHFLLSGRTQTVNPPKEEKSNQFNQI